MIDVIIPARNEQVTIPSILARFREHRFINRVIVAVDGNTRDETEKIARSYTDHVIPASEHIMGKGQLIMAALPMVKAPYVMLCDADYLNFSETHITKMAGDITAYTTKIGVPEFPAMDVPDRVISSWPWVSGIRVVPMELFKRVVLHGYLTEVQINIATRKRGYHFQFAFMNGLISPFIMGPERIAAMEDDRQWALDNGVFK